MTSWQFLSVDVTFDNIQKVDKVVSFDNLVAGAEINAGLKKQLEMSLQDFLIEAGRLGWEIVMNEKTKMVLRRRVADK